MVNLRADLERAGKNTIGYEVSGRLNNFFLKKIMVEKWTKFRSYWAKTG